MESIEEEVICEHNAFFFFFFNMNDLVRGLIVFGHLVAATFSY